MGESTNLKPKCKLIGQDGNVFNIISLVSRTLKKVNLREEDYEFQKKAFSAGSYDEVLTLANEYVEVY
jgi:hypothetical protein